jgi:cytochrome c
MIGHGGPVSALAADEGTVVSGGFDGRVILWNPENATARRIERFHDGNVTAVALVPGGFVTAGQDGRIAHWRDGQAEPALTTPRGVSPVSALAVAGERVAAGFFDGQILRLDLGTGASHAQPAHDGRVSGLAFLPDGALVSVGADLRFARWGTDGALQARSSLPDLPNGLVPAGDALAVIFAEGALRLLSADGTLLPERFLTERPLVAVAAAPGTVAAASVEGDVWLLDLPHLTSRARIAGDAGPVWALALQGDTLFGGGMDGVIRRWSVRDGTTMGQRKAVTTGVQTDGSRGAEVFGACSVCHSLAPGDHSRAGPSLHDLFGRRIASAEGYEFSPALRGMDIIWTPRTVAELFEHGPDAYTPGSRMPDQRVTDPVDRQALVDYLARMSR